MRLASRRSYQIILALAGVGLLTGIAWALASARAPRVIVLATGPEGGSYAAYGARYRDVLSRQRLEVRLRPTAGDVENLALLRDPKSGVDAALLQAGTTSAQDSPELSSLGTLFVQAVWVFRRAEQQGATLGRRFSIGPEGSGTRASTTRLLRLLGADPQSYELLPLAPDRAADDLQAGRIDSMALVAGWESPVVRRLLADPAIDLVSFLRADAFVALEPSLEKRVLPMGVGNLAQNRPPRDVALLTTTASLVVRDDLHVAVQYLLLEAASEIHGGPGIFQKAGEFPQAKGVDVPLSEHARRYHRSGPPLLHRYLPYWMAVLVQRLLIVLVPFLGIVLPLLRGAPAIYREILQRRTIRFYGELKLIEAELDARPPGADATDLVRRVAELELRAGQLRTPIYYSPLVYTLKQHIALVRSRLAERRAEHGSTAAASSPTSR